MRCHYCGKMVSKRTLIRVDEELEEMDSEMHEFVLDMLPKSNLPMSRPYTHRMHEPYGFDLLNMCGKCFKEAKTLIDFTIVLDCIEGSENKV